MVNAAYPKFGALMVTVFLTFSTTAVSFAGAALATAAFAEDISPLSGLESNGLCGNGSLPRSGLLLFNMMPGKSLWFQFFSGCNPLKKRYFQSIGFLPP
jgi:hypothetical protein